MKKPLYYVLTYDPETEEFTPQAGVRCGPYTLFGLRKALRKLQDLGYDTSRNGGFSVLVERRDYRYPGCTVEADATEAM